MSLFRGICDTDIKTMVSQPADTNSHHTSYAHFSFTNTASHTVKNIMPI